jgi:hypothetical protein
MSRTNKPRGPRGPYRGRGFRDGEAVVDPLADPTVSAFARALAEIKDPQKRACIEWFVRELAHRAQEDE